MDPVTHCGNTSKPAPFVSDNNIKAYWIMHARFKQPDYLTIGLLFQLSAAHGNRSIK